MLDVVRTETVGYELRMAAERCNLQGAHRWLAGVLRISDIHVHSYKLRMAGYT
jgi:hypothetical protein